MTSSVVFDLKQIKMFLILCFISLITTSEGSHLRGAIFTWEPSRDGQTVGVVL